MPRQRDMQFEIDDQELAELLAAVRQVLDVDVPKDARAVVIVPFQKSVRVDFA